MSLKNRRVLILFLWMVIILSGPLTVLINTPFSSAFDGKLNSLLTLQRMTGLLAYTFLFVQILLGAFMGKWVQIAGSKSYRVHVVQGLATYLFVFAHPILQTLIGLELTDKLGFVLLPSSKNITEIYLNFGRSAFMLLTIGVVAGYFRTRPFFRRNWRIFHILNYIAFFSVFIHAKYIGSDVTSQPFVYVYYLGAIVVATTSIHRIYVWLSAKYQYLRFEKEKSAQTSEK